MRKICTVLATLLLCCLLGCLVGCSNEDNVDTYSVLSPDGELAVMVTHQKDGSLT